MHVLHVRQWTHSVPIFECGCLCFFFPRLLKETSTFKFGENVSFSPGLSSWASLFSFVAGVAQTDIMQNCNYVYFVSQHQNLIASFSIVKAVLPYKNVSTAEKIVLKPEQVPFKVFVTAFLKVRYFFLVRE